MQKQILTKLANLIGTVLLVQAFSQFPDTIKVPVNYYDFHSTGACPDFNPPDDKEEITKTMAQNKLDQDGKPVRGDRVYFSYFIENWFRDWSIQPVKNKKPRYKKSNPANANHGTLDTVLDVDYDTTYKNIKIEDHLTFKHLGNGVYEFSKEDFFPLDDKGFGKEPTLSWDNTTVTNHNYSFTMTLTQEFVYTSGLKISIGGDDDIWVFINNQLVIDLGGIHTTNEDSVKLDDVATALGLESGKRYSMKIFFVERQADASNLRITSNIIKLDTTTVLLLCPMPDTIVERKPLLCWYKPQQTVSGYTVQISPSPGFTDLIVNDLASDTFYQCKTDLPTSRVYWRVRADTLGYSNVGTFYVRDLRIPVLIPYESPTTNNRPTLRWYKPPVPVTTYTLQLALATSFTNPLVTVQAADTFFTCTTDVPIDTIYWRVSADSSQFSAPGSFIVKDARIPIVIPYEPKITREKRPTLQWRKVANAQSYLINIDTTPNFAGLIVSEPAGDTLFVLKVPLPFKKIYWRVQSDLSQTWSEVDWFIVCPDTIPFLFRYNGQILTTTNCPELKWNSVSSATDYRIMLADNRGFTNAFIIPSADTTYVPPVGLKNGTWFWKVSCNKNLEAYSLVDSVVIKITPIQQQYVHNRHPAVVVTAQHGRICIKAQALHLQPEQVKAVVYDIRGKQIALLQPQGTGVSIVTWSYKELGISSGVYILRIRVQDRVFTQRIAVNK